MSKASDSRMMWLLGGGILLSLALAMAISWSGLEFMWKNWEREEYSYGYFVPLLVAFFIWQRKNELARIELRPSWWGVALALLGLGMVVAGELGTLYVVIQYGFVVMLHGIALAFLGWRGYRLVAGPLALMFLAVPLPNFLYNNLSARLQLISSVIGVGVIRLFGISVFLDGNVIQLANMKLEVAEACSGLRYLFPLMAVSFIMAYVYRAPMWKRAVLFLSSIPITVLMNSLRIGLIGVSVEYWGPKMAEGFLHDFEGWVMFMVSLGVLLLEILLLNRIGRARPAFRDTFYIEMPPPLPKGTRFRAAPLRLPVLVLLGMMTAGAVAGVLLPERQEVIPERPSFAAFPARIGDWQGRVRSLESIIQDALKVDDYLLVDYRRPDGRLINLYVAYYDSQRKGASVHSPKSCLPGDGWQIKSFDQVGVDGVKIHGQPLRVNRSVIKKGDSMQLVYYWFLERGRVETSEYLAKWSIFRDALTRNRTDGALVRLVMPVPPTSDVASEESVLVEFAGMVAPQLERFIPN